MARFASLLAILFFSLQAAVVFPELTGRVVDEAALLSEAQRAGLSAELAGLERATTDQLVVVTLKSLQGYDIADYGYRLGRRWGIGQKGKDNGVLLIVAPNERKVRIEVGYGLEGVLTDYRSKMIIENVILPAFKRGDYAGGIGDGARAIIAQLKDPAHPSEYAAAGKEDADSPWIVMGFFILYVALFVLSVLNTKGHLLGSALVSFVLAFIFYLLILSFFVSVVLFLIIFLVAYFGTRSRRGGGFGGSGGFGGFGGGGFSGGGGSFGGGGASGSW